MAEAKKPQEKKTQDQVAATEIMEVEQGLGAADDIDPGAPKGVKEPTKAPKAGPKARKATEAKEAKADKKAAANTDEDKPTAKPQAKRDRLARRGKRYRELVGLVDRTKFYDLAEGVELAKQTAKVKFDSSLELHINLGVDPRQAAQMVRSSVTLPAGTGKTLRVAVLATGDAQTAAKQAGADTVGEADLLSSIEKGKLDFDLLVATPDMMPKLAKLAKILGPKGLMPSPKSGSVTTDVAKAVKEAKAGKVEYRIDKQAIIHQAFGKASFTVEDLVANAKALIDSVLKSKPAAAKGTYVKAITVTTSMGPGIKLNVTQAIAESNPRK